MKTIVCFGDSNTWGWNPVTQQRFPRNIRWTGVLQGQLGENYDVIEEGLCGRMTIWDDRRDRYRNGKNYLIPCLESHKPLDLAIILLGTNDLKKRFVSASAIASAAGKLVNIVQTSNTGINNYAPQVLLMAPPPVGKLQSSGRMFNNAEAKSKQFGKLYRDVALKYKCHFFDTAEVIVSSSVDGVHLDASEHLKLGKAVASIVQKILMNV